MSTSNKIEVKQVGIKEIFPYAKNPRKNEAAVDAVAKSIEQFGFQQPIVVDKEMIIIVGHTRWKAAKKLKLKTVPVVIADNLTPEKAKAYRLADNQTNQLAEWDFDLLNEEIAALDDFDMSDFGFDMSEFGSDMAFTPQTEPDEVPEVETEKPVSKLGEIYTLGKHRLMCGDSTDAEQVAKLMDGKKADMVFTDPPYNVDYSNIARPKPSKKNLGVIKNDKMNVQDFKGFVANILHNANEFTKQDSSMYLWYASPSASAILTAFDESEWERNQEVIWKKPMLLGRGKYQWAHEPCVFAIKGSPYFTKDRTRTTVWDFGGYDKSKNVHPTQKPVILCEEGVNNSSQQSNLVLDLFLGSGSTLIAAEQTGRTCYGMELDEHYCDVIRKRWAEFVHGKDCDWKKLTQK